MTSVALSLKPFVDKISEINLEHLCRENPDARLEIDSDGKLIVMSPQNVCSDRRLRRLAMREHCAEVKAVNATRA